MSGDMTGEVLRYADGCVGDHTPTSNPICSVGGRLRWEECDDSGDLSPTEYVEEGRRSRLRRLHEFGTAALLDRRPELADRALPAPVAFDLARASA